MNKIVWMSLGIAVLTAGSVSARQRYDDCDRDTAVTLDGTKPLISPKGPAA
jgi:hypothetical protein